MTELKPCPFCGTDRLTFVDSYEFPGMVKMVHNKSTGGCILDYWHSSVYDDKEQATEWWNRRVNDVSI